MPIITSTYEKEEYDSNGFIVKREVTTDSTNIHKNEENEYIKIYKDSLENLPQELTLSALNTLLQLATYASYADINDLEGGMLIQLNPQEREMLEKKLNIQKATFQKNLKNLIECDLIRKISNNCFQLNPNLFGKGFYEYNATRKTGGIKDLREKWNNNLQQKSVMVDDKQPVIAAFEDEIEKLEKQIKETNDRDLKLMLQEDINRCAREIKKLSETEYSKIIDYIIQDNKEITEMQETVEDEPKLPPEGFGTPENDPFGWFQTGEKPKITT